jgi:hypothetical protein
MMILILWTVKDRGTTVDDQTGALVTETFGYDGGELALALGLRHSDVCGAVLAGSPGASYQPPGTMPGTGDDVPAT